MDFGAGTGTDTVAFLERGIKVIPCEYSNESAGFLRWRAARRGYDVEIIDPGDVASVDVAIDAVWAMDVIEHLPDPATTLAPLLRRARLFIHDSEYTGTSSGRHPFHFQHDLEKLGLAWEGLGFHPDAAWSKATGLHVLVRQDPQHNTIEEEP
jgi:hypothetical protein